MKSDFRGKILDFIFLCAEKMKSEIFCKIHTLFCCMLKKQSEIVGAVLGFFFCMLKKQLNLPLINFG